MMMAMKMIILSRASNDDLMLTMSNMAYIIRMYFFDNKYWRWWWSYQTYYLSLYLGRTEPARGENGEGDGQDTQTGVIPQGNGPKY